MAQQSPWGSAPSGMGSEMIVTTTPTVEGRPAKHYHGIVTGEVIVGANIFRDLFAGIRDIVGGRAASYENVLQSAREQALGEMRMSCCAACRPASLSPQTMARCAPPGGSPARRP